MTYSSEHDTPAGADVATFETWGAFLAQVQKPGTSKWTSSSEQGNDSWAGTRTFADAVALARNGWKEGESRMRELSRKLEVKLIHRIVREDVNYDVEGMSFDVARYLEGEPEHWVRMEESTMQADSHRHVKVLVNVAVSCGVNPDVIIARGAAIGALVELLEYAGHRVELWTCDAQSDGTSNPAFFQRYVRVKAYDQPLEPARVAFALAHPARQRRLGFRLMEQARPEISRRLSMHYGISVDAPKSVREEASLYLGRMQGYNHEEWSTPAFAEAFVLGELARQGVVLRDED
jgi:hypothetical protein